ncbi:MAG: hypothetical protein ACYC46_11250 [Acidobacteriaceae bacterium]
MTEAEIDQIREVADQPNERVQLFQKFMDERIDNIRQVATARRMRDREKQLHDLMAQFSGLADELDDNFDQYQSDHSDIRKALKKLIEGSSKWPAVLSQPPDDPAYNIVRSDALDAAKDIHDSAQKLLDDQNAWFAAHPRKKKQEQQPIIIPR